MSSDDLRSRGRLDALARRHGGAAPVFAEAAAAERPARQQRAEAAGGPRGPWHRIQALLARGGETVPGTNVSLAGLEAVLGHARQRSDGDGKGAGLARRVLEFLTQGSGPRTVGGVYIEQLDRFARMVEQRASGAPPRRRRREAEAAQSAEPAVKPAAVPVDGLEDWAADLTEEV